MPTNELWTSRFGATNEGLFVADEAGRIKYWNEGAQRLTGYPQAEVLGKRCYSVLCGRRSGRFWCQAECGVRRSVRRSTLPSHVSLEVRTRDGRRVPVSVAFLVRKERGRSFVAHLLQDASRPEQLRQTLRGVLKLLQGLGTDRAPRAPSNEPLMRAQGRSAPEADFSCLTRREVEVLRLLTDGLSTEEIARQLGVSRFTARNHVQHTLRKLDVRTRTQAVAAALAQGIH